MALTAPCTLSRLQTGLRLKSEAYVSFRQSVSATTSRVECHGGVCRRNVARYSASAATTPQTDGAEKQDPVVQKVRFVCPICQQPVAATTSDSLGLASASVKREFRCPGCRKFYPSKGGIIDLTIQNKGSIAPLGALFFQNPLIAYVYERGYRDNFRNAGFPGLDEEAQRALDILELARGEVIMDLSCGPGGFTRRFVSSGKFDMVIAADFSEAMLEQARDFIEGDKSVDLSKVVLVRADAARLPFETSSLAGVHAGAAIHCWPNVQTSVAEISRVLRAGGVFVASTFLVGAPEFLDETLKPLREAVNSLQLQLSLFSESDLKGYVESCGFVNYQSYTRGRYILFSATKPE
ncbi:hypothetical protein R1flu_010234 [Riccia fluitans]|uniref:Methyltransferase type 11 domain-containing protein n=1 Tax=Riccia fluitans TaxID=41844 RepID=A0ABD1Z8M1_9MARC